MSEKCDTVVSITLFFCRARKPEVCSRLPKTIRNFALVSYDIDLAQYGDFEEIIDYIIDDLKSRYLKKAVRKETADAWADKVRPYVAEAVIDVLSRFLDELNNKETICLINPNDTTPLTERYEGVYPSLHAELTHEVPEYCEKFIRCINVYREILNKYLRLRYGTLMYVMSRLPGSLWLVVSYIAGLLSPHERVLNRYNLKKWCYEVYYHG